MVRQRRSQCRSLLAREGPVLDDLLVERLVIGQYVTHAVALRLEVLLVELADADGQRYAVDDRDAAFLQLAQLLGVVGDRADLADAEIFEDGDRGSVVATVGREAQREVRAITNN